MHMKTSNEKTPKITYISWAASCSRSDNTARELGGKSYKIYWGWLGSHPLTVGLKYLGQAIQTLLVLFRERPDAVFVMTPPLFAVLSVLPYCWLRKKPYIQDAHTAAFLHPRWRHWQGVQRWLCRNAATTIVTNEHLADLVKKGGGKATIVRDIPVIYPIEKPFSLNGKFTIAAVCSFNYDEPVGEIFEAAKNLPEVEFYVTGDLRDLDAELAKKAPGNIKLTGFLPDAEYGALIQDAHAVLTLTTRDHTMLRGAYEAIYSGTPVILSDWPILREAFPYGAIHVNNTADDIVRAVHTLQSNHAEFKKQALKLRELKLREWHHKKVELLSLIHRK